MQYSPKLKSVMEQIKALLKENDVAGFVVLHTPGHSEYLNHLETSFSCAKIISHEGIRFKLSSKEVGKERAKLIAEGTYNMITHLADTVSMNAACYIDAHKFLKEHWNGEEFGGNHTSHNQQNN
jgi:hypothetical protein